VSYKTSKFSDLSFEKRCAIVEADWGYDDPDVKAYKVHLQNEHRKRIKRKALVQKIIELRTEEQT